MWCEMVDKLLTPAEVANIFRVDVKTVSRWAEDGKIPCLRTLGGHRRYRESDVQAYLVADSPHPMSALGPLPRAANGGQFAPRGGS